MLNVPIMISEIAKEVTKTIRPISNARIHSVSPFTPLSEEEVIEIEIEDALANTDHLSIIEEIVKYRSQKETPPDIIQLSSLEAEVLYDELKEKNKLYLTTGYELTLGIAVGKPSWRKLNGAIIFGMKIQIKD